MMSHDLETRLLALAATLGRLELSPGLPAPAEHDSDLQAAATSQADALLGRIAAVTELLKQRDAVWDAMDVTAARLVLSDLAILTGWWRGLGSVTSTRLEIASMELQDAIRSLQRALKTPYSGS